MAPPQTQLPSSTHIGRVSLIVNDLDHMTEFYHDVVGLAIHSQDQDTSILGADDHPLLVLTADPQANSRNNNETGLFHSAFRVPARSALADTLTRVRQYWHLDGAADHFVSEALYFRDPEENGIEVYFDRPKDEWTVNSDGTIRMGTVSLDLNEFRGLSTGTEIVPDHTRIGHVHLEVSSLSAAEAFYVDGLGMTVKSRYGDSAVFVAAGDYHHHIGLNTWNNRTDPPAGRGLEWFELAVPTQEHRDTILNRLSTTNDHLSRSSEESIVVDPDGIHIRLRLSE